MPQRIVKVTLLFLFANFLVAGHAAAAQGAPGDAASSESAPVQIAPGATAKSDGHRFWDRTNIALFSGMAAVRLLDYTSTRHFRALGDNEILLSNSIVDNKPLFAGIEVGATAASIGISYLLHHKGHHKLERWVSIIHIGVGGFGDARNYSLGRPGP